MFVARYGLRVVACPAHLIAELEKEREQGRRTRGQGHGVTAGRRGADQGQRPTSNGEQRMNLRVLVIDAVQANVGRGGMYTKKSIVCRPWRSGADYRPISVRSGYAKN